jgi:hypothetical protein
MATVWDVTEGFDPQVGYKQQTRVRPAAKVSCLSVIAIAVGAVFSAPETHTLAVQGWASLPVITVCTVPRSGGVPKRPARRQRDQYAPDARDGLSTRRLAQAFSSVFTPTANEDSVGIDFSFG